MEETKHSNPPWAFRPKLFDCLQNYSSKSFFADLMAGITVGIVALPLAMAFGIASGARPEDGIFTAVIAGFLISALGGSRVQIGGPTGAFIVIVFDITHKYGAHSLLICTIMAGIMLMAMSLCRMGNIIKYVPHPVTIGFTNGIAVIIFITQIKDFFGLQFKENPSEFFEKMRVILTHFNTLNSTTLLLAVGSLLVILAWPRKWMRIIPGSIVAIVLFTSLTALLSLPVETIGSRFGGIPQSLPPFIIPEITWGDIRHLISPAITIALLAAIESLLSAVVADGIIDDKHDSNQELMAQGIANVASPLFGGIPATGAIARTATNIRNGAVSPVAGIIHAGVLLLIVLTAAPLARHIPLACLSAVLMTVAFNMGEWRAFQHLKLYTRSDAVVLLVTFALTVIFDLTLAVEVGMLLACILFIRRISESTRISTEDEDSSAGQGSGSAPKRIIPPGVMVFRVFGALMFGAAEKLENLLHHHRQEPEVLILRMGSVMAMDSTAIHILESIHTKLNRHHKFLIICGAHTQPYALMEKSGLLEKLGQDNVLGNLDEALDRARELLKASSKNTVEGPGR